MCQGAYCKLWCSKEFPRPKAKNGLVKRQLRQQVIETEHTLNPVPCNFDIITCKNLDDLHSYHGRQKESQ